MSTAILYGVAFTVVILAVVVVISKLQTRFGASTLEWCGAHDGKVVVLSSILHSGGDGDPFRTGRVTWFDGATGEITRREDLASNHVGIYQRGPIVVIESGAERGVMDVRTGVIKLGAAAFSSASAAIRDEGVSSVSFQRDQESFEVISGKGERVVIPLATFDPGAEPAPATSERFAVVRDDEHAYSHLLVDGLKSPSVRLLSPTVVWQGAGGCLVAQRARLGDRAPIELTLFDAEGKPRWTAPEARFDVRAEDDNLVEALPAMAIGGLILVPLKAKRDVVVALDVNDGAVRWHVAV